MLSRLRQMIRPIGSGLGSVRYLLADVWHWAKAHRLVAGGGLILVALAGAGAWLVIDSGDSDDEIAERAPAPEVIVREVTAPEEPEELETEDLGFPAFATKNTTRVGGPDPIANAAGVALAVAPSTGGVEGPAAVTLVDAGDWPAGVAAASLAARPVGAPILLTEAGALPALTANALRALDPAGSGETGGDQVFAVGGAAAAEGFKTREVRGSNNPAELAVEIDRLRRQLAGAPDHIVVTSSEAPEFAMPAAGWAARSGDPVLFTRRDSLPESTRAALEQYKGTPVYVLGPETAISGKALAEIEKLAPNVRRVGADEPTESAIAFARYADGSFGWNINDPGHGFVVLNTGRPIDAAVAAPLSANGTWGPQLVVGDGATVPADLRGYLLDLKPGYDDDPTRAVYNHIWLIGDQEVLSVGFQAQLDELAEVAPVRSGPGP